MVRNGGRCSLSVAGRLLLGIAALLWRHEEARSQVDPAGSEFQVNTYTSGLQRYPSVASDARGNFVVVWTSEGSAGSDQDYLSIHLQRFSAAGSRLGGELQVNSYTSGSQYDSVAASDAVGDFVVVWTSDGSNGPDDDGFSIQAERIDADGAPLTDQFQVNAYTTSWQGVSAVASNRRGGFVVAWSSLGSRGTDDYMSIQARRLSGIGAPAGGQFQVNGHTPGVQKMPAVSCDGSGRCVIAWASDGSNGTDDDGFSIQAQRIDTDGTPLGDQFEVNTYTTGLQYWPAVASSATGDFVVVWESEGSSGTDLSRYSIQAQRFSAAGARLGSQFQVNTYTTGDQLRPRVCSDSGGGFVVVWTSYGSSGSDDDLTSVQARRYDASGVPLGDQIQVNSHTTEDQFEPTVASDALGGFVVTWTNVGATGTDPAWSIRGQRYVEALFYDGFEGGDTEGWTRTVP
ncbi:MAG: hypothetical protein H6Q02_2077 [Acidobacteria bacterium]|nr:hypothetical protein [Acidobacteriota bacterium]